jgi:hypothetical protein
VEHESAVTTLDGVIEALYRGVSGPAGPRDALADSLLFHPTARLTRTWVDEHGVPQAKVMTHAEYVADTAPFFAANDFWEFEVGRVVHRLGNLVHVLSIYEARLRPDDPAPERRGVNSAQLFFDGARWWIMNLIWANEREGARIPAEWNRA